MLIRGGLTTAGQFSSSPLVCCADRSSVLQLCILSHHPYDPNLYHATFIFLNMNSFLKGKRLSNDESLVSKVKAWLQAQPDEFYGTAPNVLSCVGIGGRQYMHMLVLPHKT